MGRGGGSDCATKFMNCIETETCLKFISVNLDKTEIKTDNFVIRDDTEL